MWQRVSKVARASEIIPRKRRNHIDRLRLHVRFFYLYKLHQVIPSVPTTFFFFSFLSYLQMDGWADYLHSSLNGEHALFPALRLSSFGTFIIAAVFSASICLTERSLTFALSQHWAPFRTVRQSRVHNALWRAGLYALATLLRLLYMLLSMTFHIWLILVIVFSLTFGQFLIEYYEQPHDYSPLATTHHHHRNTYNVTLPTTSQSPPSPRIMLPKARGNKVKPAGLFIHPNNSNLARADAAAVELGLHRSTERVEALRTSCDSDDDDVMATWGKGRGRDAARNLLRSATLHRQTRSHSRSESQQKLFQVGDSESDG